MKSMPNSIMTIKEQNIIIENYEQELIANIPNDIISYSEMSNHERKFLNGLLRYFKPKRVLEVGVSAGGGSAIIWNAIKDIENSELYSIDVRENWYVDSNKSTAFAGIDFIGESEARWHRHFGKDSSEIMDDLIAETGEKFDFLVLDTVHVHPVESINLLTLLPYLKETAIIVIHDVALYQIRASEDKPCDLNSSFACHFAFNNLVGDKLQINAIESNVNSYHFSNIGCVQINSDTSKYIRDLFYGLQFPWGFIYLDFPNIEKVIFENYDEECCNIYKKAKLANIELYKNSYKSYK
jgi:Predicted O-methyltransferase